MKVEILRQVMISGEPAMAGSILEISDDDARILIGLDKAVEYQEAPVVCPAKPPAKEEAPSCPPKKPATRRSTK